MHIFLKFIFLYGLIGFCDGMSKVEKAISFFNIVKFPVSNIITATLGQISVLRGINKSLQRLPRHSELCEGQGVCRIHFKVGEIFS